MHLNQFFLIRPRYGQEKYSDRQQMTDDERRRIPVTRCARELIMSTSCYVDNLTINVTVDLRETGYDIVFIKSTLEMTIVGNYAGSYITCWYKRQSMNTIVFMKQIV